jgi:hypothetical protein
VFVHLGEPKTGTTFLQEVLWGNRDALAATGVHLPGTVAVEHWRAAQDLRQVPLHADDPGGWAAGDWDRIAREAATTPGTSVISSEVLAAASEEQARRALASLAPAQVHLAITVRDLATLLPAEWQESVKHRSRAEWQEWVARVIRESGDPDRRRWWFWKVHDTVDIARAWGTDLRPERVHIVTVPPPGSPPGLLWHRFAHLLGIDPSQADLAVARPNASLGITEVELLRRLNATLPASYPDWAYTDWVKECVAQKALAGRAQSPRLQLPEERVPWAEEEAERVVDALKQAGYDIVGDLDDLRPRPAGVPPLDPSSIETPQLLEAALDGLSGVLVEIEDQRRAAAESPRPLVKELLHHMADRHPSVDALRLRYWHAVEAVRRERRRRGWSVGG